MKRESEFFKCVCESNEHTVMFELDHFYKNYVELSMSIFLNQYRGFFRRLLIAVKYLFGYKCKYGHWDCVILKSEDTDRLIELLQKYKQLS